MVKLYTTTPTKPLFLIRGIALLFCIALVSQGFGQLQNIPCTGYNADVVANGTARSNASTNNDIDANSYVLISNNFNPGSGICRTTNVYTTTVSSLRTAGLTYYLQSAANNNSLRIIGGDSGSLIVTTPVSINNLYILATGGGGECSVDITVTFTDNSILVFTNQTIQDWCSGDSPATAQLYRTLRSTSTTCNTALCPYLYELNLAINSVYQYRKIKSITFENGAGAGILNVFAVGGNVVTPPTCTTPTTQPSALILTPSSITVNGSFTAGTNADSYLILRNTTNTLSASPVNNSSYPVGTTLGGATVVSYQGGTSFTDVGPLAEGTIYYYFIFAANSNCANGPIYLTDSPLSNSSTVTSTGIANYSSSSTWTCPAGVTSIQVECRGAGGGGGYGRVGAAGGGGGGGGGAYTKNTAVAVTPGTVYTVTVGTPGAAGVLAVSNGDGGNGSASSFNGMVIANGGTGGKSYASGRTGGAGGAASGGVSYKGGNGATGANTYSGGGGGGAGSTAAGSIANNATGGNGGTVGGGKGGNGSNANYVAGSNGANYGGGGAGGTQQSNGGIGGNGYVTITCPCTTFYPTFSNAPTGSTCLGSNVTYTTQMGLSNYNWTVPGTAGTDYIITAGGIGTSNHTVTLTWLTTGTKTVTVNYSVSGCVGTAAASSSTTVYAIPTISTSTSNSRCGSGEVTLNATASSGSVNWYAASTGGSSLHTGTSYTPTVSTTTSYYADATNNGCTTATRTEVTATVNQLPSITTVATPSVCSGSSFSFTPEDITNGIVPAGTTYSWSAPSVTGSMTGGNSGLDEYSISGTLINNTTLPQTATYTVTPTVGTCTGISFVVSATINPIPTVLVADGYTCLGGTVTFEAQSDISGSSYKWYQTAVSTDVLENTNIYTTPVLIDTTDYYVEATADGCSSTRVKVTAYLSGKNTTWTGAVNNNWNNAANWTEGVPCSISNTTITDVSSVPNYPIISSNTACKNIVFEPGGAVLGLQYLSYEKAFVKTSLRRNTWYTLTAPLKEMYSGDYYFNGAPETFMQLFDAPSPDAIGPNVTYEGTFTRAFKSLQVPLSMGEGFAYKISEKTWNYPFGASNIPSDLDISFPRLNPDSSLLTSYIPYSGGNGMPYSFLTKTVTKNPALAYRFAAENAANELTDITYTLEPGINLVGNPLMTHLDFNKLYLNNMAYIENKVKFWNGETFTTYITNQDLENAISSSDNTTNIIPPMQAFFVISPTGGTLTFDLENDFVANNSMKLRAASVKPNVLFIESDNGQMKSFAAIAKRQYAKNDFDSNDAFKLFSQHKNAPEVYTIANDMALDINQFEEFPFTVPLCIKTDSGNVMLSFNGVESFGNDVTIELINTKTGEVVDLKEENRYQYTVTPTKDEGSLFISFRNASLLTDIETIGIDHGIQIIANNQHAIKVISSPNDPIKEVLVFDVSGRKIQHACVSNTYNVELPVFVKNEIYLVQVFTENNTRIGKVLVK